MGTALDSRGMVMETPIRLLAIHDDGLLVEAIGSMLRQTPSANIEWLGVQPAGDDVRNAVLAHEPDVLLVDVEAALMREQAIHDALRARPATRVAVLGRHLSFTQIVRCLEAGAWGYIEKDDGQDAILQATLRIARGEIAISPRAEDTLRERGWRVARQPAI
jgi:DNA-binding NarL/FixJ family response regulator